jgi:hypothetical protein
MTAGATWHLAASPQNKSLPWPHNLYFYRALKMGGLPLQAGLGALQHDFVQNCDMLRLQRWWSTAGTA